MSVAQQLLGHTERRLTNLCRFYVDFFSGDLEHSFLARSCGVADMYHSRIWTARRLHDLQQLVDELKVLQHGALEGWSPVSSQMFVASIRVPEKSGISERREKGKDA